jgi:hypothetical protein
VQRRLAAQHPRLDLSFHDHTQDLTRFLGDDRFRVVVVGSKSSSSSTVAVRLRPPLLPFAIGVGSGVPPAAGELTIEGDVERDSIRSCPSSGCTVASALTVRRSME